MSLPFFSFCGSRGKTAAKNSIELTATSLVLQTDKALPPSRLMAALAVGDFCIQCQAVLLPQVPEDHLILDGLRDRLVNGTLHNHKA